MTTIRQTIALAAAVATLAGASVLASTTAEARGGKEVFVQEYNFKRSMHGYSGHSGNYYCDYQRLPQRRCVITANGGESCKIVGWTLRQMCQ
ncbi:MAG: hypothetical protein ACRCS9_15795 [Hyphomicrobium sp.]